MAVLPNPQPTVEGFLTFLRQVVSIPAIFLPDNNVIIQDSFDGSLAVTAPWLCTQVGGVYSRAVYNLGTDSVINYAIDQPNQTYFRDLRKSLGIGLFVPGVTGSSSDSGTSQARVTPEFMKHMTFGDLQALKTPYGRAYLAVAQTQGSLWGIS